jgi:serine/threonine-protein kinase HipA
MAAPDTGTGQVLRGRISPTCRDTLRVRLEQFAARGDVTFAVVGLHRAAVHHQEARAGAERSDPYPVVKAEAVAMELARRVGLDVARTGVIEVLGNDVLLVDRFDRPAGGRLRRMVISGLTILSLDLMMARYATYYDLADAIRNRFAEPKQTLRELFSRIIFNICVSNTDDHARNHAAFWDGKILTLTRAYDICPQLRSGGEATQVMAIRRDGYRYSQLAGCVAAATGTYLLSNAEAKDVIDHQVDTIRSEWDEAAEVARLTAVERDQLWGRQILNPHALEDAA